MEPISLALDNLPIMFDGYITSLSRMTVCIPEFGGLTDKVEYSVPGLESIY